MKKKEKVMTDAEKAIEDYRTHLRHTTRFAEGLAEFRRYKGMVKTLEEQARIQGLDDFVYWYWGTSMDHIYYKKEETAGE